MGIAIRLTAAAAVAACVFGLGLTPADAGHDDVKLDPALKRYPGKIIALGEPDAEGRIYSFRGIPLGPKGTSTKYAPGELRGWRLTLLAGKRFSAVFEVKSNTDSEITVNALDGPLNGIAESDLFIVEQIAIAR
jgi:hypothetical protein